MCGGDDHLAWKCPVSSKACRGLHTAGGIGSSFSVWIYHLGLEYRGAQYLVLHTLQDWFFILSVDLSSWVRVEGRLVRFSEISDMDRRIVTVDHSWTWDDLDNILVTSLPAKFRMPDIERYAGVGCPCVHLRLCSTMMRGLIRDPRGKFGPNWSRLYFIRELTPKGAAWFDGSRRKPILRADQCGSTKRTDSVVFGLPGSFARSLSLTGCSLRRGHDRYLTEPPRSIQLVPHFSTLDAIMPLHLGGHLGYMCMIQL
ncbi:hypothetical protein CK203_117751 [Vitis vinifera]|uniref:Uncharacterized protein n=1 Tax=Vitis vinifera TaxID=29760 RepID=A0A438CSW0_VITVI|nr:hypothetical protein CK203_117751 [Vitis vinifera]